MQDDQALKSTTPTTFTGAMSATMLLLVGLLLIAATALGTYLWRQQIIDTRAGQVRTLTARLSEAEATITMLNQKGHYTSSKGVAVMVYIPGDTETVSSPLTVLGQVPGSWSSEAQFPIELQDAAGQTIARTTAHLLGDWTTDALVPFSATLSFSGHAGERGALVLRKDNPSGLSKNDDLVQLPMQF